MLSWIASQQRPCGVREIAAGTGINKTSVHRFLDALRSSGWVSQDSATGKYAVGAIPVEIGLAALSRMEFRVVARPLLDSLNQRTGETSYLGVLLRSEVVYVDVVLGAHAIVANRFVGSRFPAHRTAIGKVLLAAMVERDLDRLYSVGPEGTGRDHPGGEIDALKVELNEVRRSGVAYNREESGPGVYSVAAPVLDFGRRVVAGIGLGGPRERVLPHLELYQELVREAGVAASLELGCPASAFGNVVLGRTKTS